MAHAREMILRAAAGEGGTKPKPDLVVLPVSYLQVYHNLQWMKFVYTNDLLNRNVLILHTACNIFPCTPRKLDTRQANHTISLRPAVRVSRCSLLSLKKQAYGFLEVLSFVLIHEGMIWS